MSFQIGVQIWPESGYLNGLVDEDLGANFSFPACYKYTEADFLNAQMPQVIKSLRFRNLIQYTGRAFICFPKFDPRFDSASFLSSQLTLAQHPGHSPTYLRTYESGLDYKPQYSQTTVPFLPKTKWRLLLVSENVTSFNVCLLPTTGAVRTSPKMRRKEAARDRESIRCQYLTYSKNVPRAIYVRTSQSVQLATSRQVRMPIGLLARCIRLHG